MTNEKLINMESNDEINFKVVQNEEVLDNQEVVRKKVKVRKKRKRVTPKIEEVLDDEYEEDYKTPTWLKVALGVCSVSLVLILVVLGVVIKSQIASSKAPLLDSEISIEGDFPIALSEYGDKHLNHFDSVVTQLATFETHENITGVYTVFGENPTILVKDGNPERMQSTLLHEYAHFISRTVDSEYFDNLELHESEVQTDVIAYFIAKEKGILGDFNPNYTRKRTIPNLRADSKELDEMIKKVIEVENGELPLVFYVED